jgi:hypothetical protein
MASDQPAPMAWGSLQQSHGHTAQIFKISAALNGPGLGFLLELAGKGAALQRNGTQVNKS